MTFRRGKDRRSNMHSNINNLNNNNNNNNINSSSSQQPNYRSLHNRNLSNLAQPSDYESDIPNNYISDSQAPNGSSMATDPSQLKTPSRTNEELNLSVLQRHNPAIHSILSLAPYAVVYVFSATKQLWEKSGIEGTLFVCQLTQGELGEERYSVLVLNRRGMDNFEARLTDGDDVEVTEEYVILKVESTGAEPGASTIKSADGRESVIYGLWIFSEPAPSSTAEARTLNARIIKEYAVHGGESRKFALERAAVERRNNALVGAAHVDQHGDEGVQQGGVPMGRQISLKELFGQQRQQDDEWSVKVHSPSLRNVDLETQLAQQNLQSAYFQQQENGNWPVPPAAPPTNGARNDVLGALFRKAYQGPPK
ncbi:hypothetical protein PABG_00303 [Paracoccidioides brasiliensis Pb03]|nr:hypothetical protein PABG_00303 [Paracoccidioides brasiliensis Pb03]